MLITLWYGGGFCHTLAWICNGCTHVPQISKETQTLSDTMDELDLVDT